MARSRQCILVLFLVGICSECIVLGQFFNKNTATQVKSTTQARTQVPEAADNGDALIQEALARIDRLNQGSALEDTGSASRGGTIGRPNPLRPAYVPPPVSASPPPADSQFSAFAARGNAQTFSPADDPRNIRPKPPQVQKLTDTDQLDAARRQLSQDFLPTCPDATFSYIIPSPTQCDLYYLCEYGTPSKKLCEDGMVFSIEDVKCVSASLGNCEDRPLLQPPRGTGPCLRRNGIFYTNETCTEFVTCRDNNPSFERCAEGLVYDPAQQICAWSDEALRPGCLPEDLLGFRCPNPKLTAEQALLSRVVLRFGDHDRHPDPKDCRYFFMCLRTGHPRRAGCSAGKVFDPESGGCKAAKEVPQCADYYGEVRAPTPVRGGGAPDPRLQTIEDNIQKQFEEQRKKLIQLRIKRHIMESEAEPEPYSRYRR